ncbi:MAG: DegT/DnrJ/EryC1/StrS family aminotransferase [Chthoniobacterales bacterium]
MKYPVFEPDFGEPEIEAVVAAMRRGEISGTFGRAISDFEESFARYCGSNYGVAVSNGTVALQLAVRVGGVGPGDEVLVSSCTNIASGLAVFYNNAVTVPVDSEDHTWNLDLDLLESLITPRTKAIVLVHLLGNPVDMTRLMAIANKHSLLVIEDCAEAHGAIWKGRKVGSFGHMNCFSFLSNKVITTGEGGMILTDDAEMARQLKYLRSLAFGPVRFLHEEAGYNFRISSMQAAMGVVQVAKIESVIEQKIALYRRYKERLQHLEGIQFPVEPADGRHVHWMVGIRIRKEFGPTRDVLKDHLTKEGIDTRTLFCPMNQQPFLVGQEGYRNIPCPVADRIWEDGIYLPSTTALTDSDLDFICEKVATCGR